jgi:PAS domain S-box-containing protein
MSASALTSRTTQSFDLYRGIVDAFPQPMVVVRDSRVLAGSAAAERLLGLRAGDDLALVLPRVEAAVAEFAGAGGLERLWSPQPDRGDAPLIRFKRLDPDLSEIMLVWESGPVPAPSSAQLLKSADLNRTLLSSLPQRIFFKDTSGAFVAVNELFARDLGLEPDQLIGKRDHDFFPHDLADKYRADDVRLIRSGDTETIVETNVVQGERRVVEVVKRPVISETGEVLGILGVFTDITERKQVEEELRHERHLLHTLMDNVPDLIYFKDAESRFTRINLAQMRNLGLDCVEEAYGKSDGDFFPEEQAARFKADEEELLRTGEPLLNKIETQRTPDGGERWNLTTKVPVFDEAGEPAGIIGVSKDLTEHVRAEAELKRTAEELARSNEDLQQFAYVASHDLQEPLRMVASYTQLLARRYSDRLDDDAREFIEYAVDGATRMQGLINDLLHYSRVGTRGVSFETMPLESALDRAYRNLQTAIEESGAVVTHDPLPRVYADPSQAAQLFQNLIGNAIKFAQPGVPPRVHISAGLAGDEWLISVADNGIGIDPAYASRIFVIFQRLHTKTEYPGTGIGLSICKKIVNRHGGNIWVDQGAEGGSVFRFTLPANAGAKDGPSNEPSE